MSMETHLAAMGDQGADVRDMQKAKASDVSVFRLSLPLTHTASGIMEVTLFRVIMALEEGELVQSVGLEM
jgi:hypothetical protein